jgi:hypothetical protein
VLLLGHPSNFIRLLWLEGGLVIVVRLSAARLVWHRIDWKGARLCSIKFDVKDMVGDSEVDVQAIIRLVLISRSSSPVKVTGAKCGTQAQSPQGDVERRHRNIEQGHLSPDLVVA